MEPTLAFTAALRASAALAIAGMILCSARTAHAEASSLDPTIGYNYGEIETPRNAGTAGAQRAFSSSTSALFVNPANIAAERVYHIGGFAQIWPEAKRQSYGIAATDSVSSGSRVAGSAGATYNFQDTDGIDRHWTDLRVALAYPFSDQFSVGVGGHYLWLSQNGTGPLGASYVSGGLQDKQIVRSFSFDAAATLKPSPQLSFALVGVNLTNPGNGFLPTSIGGAIGYAIQEFSLEADVVGDFTSWDRTTVRAMGGAELLIAGHLGLRGGYRYDEGAKSHLVALGLAYMDRSYILDIGAHRVVSGDTATAIVLGFTYHLETTGLTPSSGDTF